MSKVCLMCLEVGLRQTKFHWFKFHCLQVKNQKPKCDWFVSRLKWNKKGARYRLYRLKCIRRGAPNLFRGFKASRKIWLMFCRLNNTGKGRRDNFKGIKTLNNVKPMYLEVKLKEAKFKWSVYRLKAKREEQLMYLLVKMQQENVRVRSSEAEMHKVRIG